MSSRPLFVTSLLVMTCVLGGCPITVESSRSDARPRGLDSAAGAPASGHLTTPGSPHVAGGGSPVAEVGGRAAAAPIAKEPSAWPEEQLPREQQVPDDARDDDDAWSQLAESAHAGPVPETLIGTWYAGSGGVSAPYDSSTGAFGAPNGDGLSYSFHADGSFEKAFSSRAANGGCEVTLTSYEVGNATFEGGSMSLTSTDGVVHYRASCDSSLNSDRPADLGLAQFSWQIEGDALRLTARGGASSTFRRIE